MAGAFDAKQALLQHIATHGVIDDTTEFAALLGVEHQPIVGALKSLEALNYLKASSIEHKSWQLTDEGESYCSNGAPEAQVS
jgi:phenylalanyl-tRNA synthetase alpha chain